MSEQAAKPRYVLLDTLRGLCVVSMALYHAMYDLVNIKGFSVPWFRDWPGYVWQQSICWTFILLSGFCWSLSRHPVKRGLLLTGCGAAVTLVTYFFMPSELILFGVLTLLGLSALLLNLLTLLFQRLGRQIPPQAGLIGSLLLFFLLRGVPQGYLGFEGLRLWELPPELYRLDFLAVLGFPSPSFFSSDYFPLIPWFFLYLSGYFLWKLASRSDGAKCLLRGGRHGRGGIRPLAFLGRRSLIVYLLHQPALLGLFLLLPE